MRRIYESDALRRDDGPFSPTEVKRQKRPQRNGTGEPSFLSKFIPQAMANKAVYVSVTTPRKTYPRGVPIPFSVHFKNSMPFSVSIPTKSPLLWTWNIDGIIEASHVSVRDPPDETDRFGFNRGERKTFTRRWSQSFRLTDSTWEPAATGRYTIGVGINVDDPVSAGLYDEVTIEIVDE